MLFVDAAEGIAVSNAVRRLETAQRMVMPPR